MNHLRILILLFVLVIIPSFSDSNQNAISDSEKISQLNQQSKEYKVSEIFKTLFIAICGGLTVYYVPKLLKYIYFRGRPILTYQFDDDGTDKGLRRIHHSFGQAIDDRDASNGKCWEHTSDKLNPGAATCYGPYTKEIPFKGKYKARYRIKAEGIKKKLEPILVLDITHGQLGNKGDVVTLGLPLVEKQLLGKNFKEGKYKNFDVSFDYDGQSLIEFRCQVINPTQYKQNVDRILFDNVKVFHTIEFF